LIGESERRRIGSADLILLLLLVLQLLILLVLLLIEVVTTTATAMKDGRHFWFLQLGHLQFKDVLSRACTCVHTNALHMPRATCYYCSEFVAAPMLFNVGMELLTRRDYYFGCLGHHLKS
jgi:hypothetical protein